MSEFVASNGRRVVCHRDRAVDVIGTTRTVELSIPEVEALREFFRDERDTELGRWRWPGNPDYIVHPNPNGSVTVREESDPFARGAVYWRANSSQSPFWDWEYAARAYFEAHPEPKPWHDAKPGEVWELTYRSPRADEVSNRVMTVVQDGPNVSFFNEWRLHTIHYTGIESARRIWPEVSNG